MTCNSISERNYSKISKKPDLNEIQIGHAYSVLDVVLLKRDKSLVYSLAKDYNDFSKGEKIITLIKLRNPNGHFTWSGDW